MYFNVKIEEEYGERGKIMDEKVEKMMKQMYENKKESLETRKKDLERMIEDQEKYIIEMKEKKQYHSFLQELLLQQEDEVIKRELQGTIEKVEGVLYYEEGELERFEDQKQKMQRMIDLIEPDVQALERFLIQGGAEFDESNNG